MKNQEYLKTLPIYGLGISVGRYELLVLVRNITAVRHGFLPISVELVKWSKGRLHIRIIK